MDWKKQVAALAILSAVQCMGVVRLESAAIDEELAVIAAEQEGVEVFNAGQNESEKKIDTSPEVEPVKIPEPPKVPEKIPEPEKIVEPPKIPEKIPEPEKIVEPPKVTEKAAEPKKIVESPKITEKAAEPEKIVEPPKVVENIPVQPAVTEIPAPVSNVETPAVGLPNPRQDYTNFDAMAEAVKFISLYIPKKSGYVVNSMTTIDNKVSEIRYGRRWEPEVSLTVRTYRRQEGEDLKDISGVHGVKWRIDMTSGTSVYIAKIDERSHVAAWSVGDFTFSAHVENLSFAAFHSLVIDELVDLSTHYFVKIAD